MPDVIDREKPGTFTVVPLCDRVLVRKVGDSKYEYDEASKMFTDRETGLVATTSQMESRPEAEVVAIGPSCTPKFRELVKVGDTVLLGEHSGLEFQKTILVFEEEILALLKY